MQVNSQLLTENICDILSESTWSEGRHQELSWKFKYKMSRRGYELHEKAVLLLNSFSGITLQKEYKEPVNKCIYRVIMKFISDDYFPKHLGHCTQPNKKADAIFLNDFAKSSTCLIACVNYGLKIETRFDSSSHIDLYIYLMANGDFYICDYSWCLMWHMEGFENLLSHLFDGNKFIADDAIILDAPEYRPNLSKLGLPGA